MTKWKEKISEPGFVRLNDSLDLQNSKSNKSFNHKNQSSDKNSIIELVNNE